MQISVLLIALIFFSDNPRLESRIQDSQNQVTEKIEFKLSNEVYVGESTTPLSTNLTLFDDQRVFDFRYSANNKLQEIAIFDAKDRSFVLLDVDRELRLKIDNLQLLRILEGMRKELEQSPKVSHLLFTDSIENYEPAKETIQVVSPRIQYEVKGKRPNQDQVLVRYLRFLENYTLLSVTDPRRMPPFARIKVNRAIKKFGILPDSVSLTIRDAADTRNELVANSRHKLQLRLSGADRALIDSARGSWMEFREVELAEYREIRVAQDPAEKKKNR